MVIKQLMHVKEDIIGLNNKMPSSLQIFMFHFPYTICTKISLGTQFIFIFKNLINIFQGYFAVFYIEDLFDVFRFICHLILGKESGHRYLIIISYLLYVYFSV